MSVKLASPTTGNKFYQCVLAALIPSQDLLSLHEALLASFDLPVPSPPTYFPHLSLIYDDKLSFDDKEKLIQELKDSGEVQDFPDLGRCSIVGEQAFQPTEILLVKTQGPPPEWEVLHRIPLATSSTPSSLDPPSNAFPVPSAKPLVMLGATGQACEGEFCEL
ncbi:hypothetical protein T439DRAFT_355513 [Meredithblackwellia eburnea MCA 4105]